MHALFSFFATLCLLGFGVCMIAFPAAMLHDVDHPKADASLKVIYAMMSLMGGLLVFGPLAAITSP